MEASGGDRAVVGFVYGVRLRNGRQYRYVGITQDEVPRRLRRHVTNARQGRKTPFYDWLRREGGDAVTADVLETIVSSRADLGAAEVRWIAALRAQGARLLNLSAGGLGPTGVVWTDEQREAARQRSLGRPGVSRFGAENPFFGKSHSAEQKAIWSESRRGTYLGADNPNFGKFGPDHPGFGREMTDAQRQRLSESRRGELNPNFGKSASAETRARRSASLKGRPMPSSRRSAHTRYHTNQGRVSEECAYCQEAVASAADQEREKD